MNVNEFLPADVAAEFETVNWPGGWRVVFPAFSHLVQNGTVNLKLLTPRKAGVLVDAGFPYLRRRQSAVGSEQLAVDPAPFDDKEPDFYQEGVAYHVVEKFAEPEPLKPKRK